MIQRSGDDNAVFELSPQGRNLYEQMLAACSAHAGRLVSGDEISAVLRKLRRDLDVDDVDFHNSCHMERFKNEIASLGGQ